MANYSCSLLPLWYNYRDKIDTVIIEDGAIRIDSWAFYQCSSLTSIRIPISVEIIASGAFNGCANMTDIYCESESQPEGWERGNEDMISRGGTILSWLGDCTATVHWGYKGAGRCQRRR